MLGGQNGDQCVHEAFGKLTAVAASRGRGGHVQADGPYEHQGPSPQGGGSTVGRDDGPVICQPTEPRATPLDDLGREVTLHQAQPVPVHQRLVARIDGHHRVLAVHDRREGRFEENVGDAGQVVATHTDPCGR